MPLATELFDIPIPERLIAQVPADRRDRSRLLVVDRASRAIAHRLFSDLPEYLRKGDVLVRNNAAVLPARLKARRPTGGEVECLLLRPFAPTSGADSSGGRETWLCLVRPGRRLNRGATFSHPSGCFVAEVVDRFEDGTARVSFTVPGGRPIADVAGEVGDMPLPPYIGRSGHAAERALDIERYQTVYANRGRTVAAAAPTAGLHFTPELLTCLEASGICHAEITLHVGIGTFRPIQAPTIEEHPIHREVYEMSCATQRALFQRGEGRRIAVGTTSVRACEDFLSRHAEPLDRDFVGEASLFIHPPRTFRGVDALITNFHQPRSTLLCLVAAFLAPGTLDGIGWLRELYAEAVAREYRFFSYGDAMLIL